MSRTLTDADVEAIAARVVQMLDRPPPAAEAMVGVAELARLLDVSRGFIYAHADDLGVVRMGKGTRARLRFDPEVARTRLAALAETPESARAHGGPPGRARRTRRAALPPGVTLIQGRPRVS